MSTTRKPAAESKARDEAFDAGRQFVPTAFAPKGSPHARPHGSSRAA